MPYRGRAAAPAVRSGADSGVILIAPVGEVVPTLIANPGMVADLIGREPRGDCHFASQGKQVRRSIVLQWDKVAEPDHRLKSRARLNCQLVQRQVSRAQCKCALQFLSPTSFVLPGAGIDEVERHAREMLLRHLECGQSLVGIMEPPKEAQRRIVERLQSQRSAVNPGARECGIIRCFNR